MASHGRKVKRLFADLFYAYRTDDFSFEARRINRGYHPSIKHLYQPVEAHINTAGTKYARLYSMKNYSIETILLHFGNGMLTCAHAMS
jgi:hypothetical protein